MVPAFLYTFNRFKRIGDRSWSVPVPETDLNSDTITA